MPGVAVLVADGFETIECLTAVDVLRRGGVKCATVSVMATRETVSSQQVPVTCDYLFDEVDFDDFDYIMLPGGLPGATNLGGDERVLNLVRRFAAEKHVAAICAAPAVVLAKAGVLEGHQATCFPSFADTLPGGVYAGPKTVVVSGNIITASAMGQALPFALAILKDIAGDQAVEKVRESIQL